MRNFSSFRHALALSRQKLQCVRKHAASFSTVEGSESDVLIERGDDGFATVILNREKQHNTFNDVVISRFMDVFDEVASDSSIRGIFLESRGKFFSAGGDLKWMKKAGTEYTEEQNTKDALRLSEMLYKLNTLPMPTIALVQGPCYGGGVGLVSCCDIAIAVPEATFTLSEVKLGILPATISPYVVAKIGAAQARRYFLTAEMFDSVQAQKIGIINELATSISSDESCKDGKSLEDWKMDLRTQLKLCAPTAVAASKDLINAVNRPITPDVMNDTAVRLSTQRQSIEGQAGLYAFLNREKPPWI